MHLHWLELRWLIFLNYRFVSEDEFDSEIKTANMNLNEKGVYIEVLRNDRYEFIDICIQTKYVI